MYMFYIFPGFGYGEDQHFFNWHVDYKGHVTDVTLDETIIPILKQQGIVSELGILALLDGEVKGLDFLLYVLKIKQGQNTRRIYHFQKSSLEMELRKENNENRLKNKDFMAF